MGLTSCVSSNDLACDLNAAFGTLSHHELYRGGGTFRLSEIKDFAEAHGYRLHHKRWASPLSGEVMQVGLCKRTSVILADLSTADRLTSISYFQGAFVSRGDQREFRAFHDMVIDEELAKKVEF